MIDPARAHPIVLPDGTAHEGTVFLRAVVTNPRFEVGEFTYASSFEVPEDWATHLAPYLFPFSNETLRIGRFCQIAHGVRFITSSANHDTKGISTYPFPVFDLDRRAGYQPDQRDTEIGHDVWLGHGATIMPGSRIGNGVIVGAGAVVRGSVPDYAIVTGNPAKTVTMRFDTATIARLLALAWWDWPIEQILAAEEHLQACDLDALERMTR